MLSVSKLTPGQEAYYERSVAAGLDDYYAGRGESPGVWAGRGAADLGLDGTAEEGQLGALVRGRHPKSGAELRRHAPARTIRIERIDPATGERWREEKKLAPVAGFDLVFSVPKSVSLLHALGDEGTRRAIAAAHRSAWGAALAYLEEEACVTRRGKDGVRRERGGGFLAAAYQHRTSRAQDPHLHTHVIVANMTRSPSDGKWRALDGEAILKTYRLAAGYLYEAHLRHELSRTLGVEWQEPDKGWAELEGVPRSVIDAFSRRRAQVVERLAEQATSSFYAARVAAVATREAKEEVDLPRLRAEWRARASEHGLGRRELRALLGRRLHREPSPAEVVRIAERLLGPEGLTEKRSAFSEAELVMAWADAHAQGAPVAQVRALAARMLELPGIEPVAAPTAVGRASLYSTSDLLRIERSALALVERGRNAGAPAVPPELIENALPNGHGRRALSVEQERLVRDAAGMSDRVVCIVGRAGSGKTTATRAVARAFDQVAVPVLGAAPSGIAAERLQDDTGIAAMTLHRLLREARRHGSLPPRCVVVVDEAGMAETRVLAPLLELVEAAGGKAVLVGDPEQLPAVGAGGLFAAVVERGGAIELSQNHRQRDGAERRALDAVRAGLGREYVAFAHRNERLVVCEDLPETRARLLADWWRCARDDAAGSVMIALRRSDVAELNTLARALMEQEGKLGDDRLTVARHEFAEGDRVVCRRNSDVIGVRNGTRATVVDVESRDAALAIETDRGERVTLPRRYLEAGHLQHAYALTGHAGQGLSVEHAFVLGAGGGALKEWGYVALSRARETTHVYLTAGSLEAESHFHELDERDPRTRLAQALERPAAQRLATEQRASTVRPRRGTRPVIAPRPNEQALRSRLRLLEQNRTQVERVHAGAERRLADAQARLARAGWRERRRSAMRLRAEIGFQRSALAAAECKLADIDREHRRLETRLARVLERPAPARGRARELPARERGRQLTLDLGL